VTEIKAEQEPEFYFEVEFRDAFGFITLRAIRVHAKDLAVAFSRARAYITGKTTQHCTLKQVDEDRYDEFPYWQCYS
jgi:hypothetical protein